MTVTFRQLVDEVMAFKLQSNQTLAWFCYPSRFEDLCKRYLYYSPADVDYPFRMQRRFETLNFDGLVMYNCHKGPLGFEFEKCTAFATVDDIKDWRIAIRCLQRYCRNLLLAPRRQDFHQITVSRILCKTCIANACLLF